MPDVVDGGFVVTAEVSGLNEIATKLENGLVILEMLHNRVEYWTNEAWAKAVQNVSGVSVTYSGGTFVVNRQTGNLARTIGVTFPNFLAGIVKASADYADAIEAGHGPIDLKKTMQGKVVPIVVPAGTKGSKMVALKNGSGATSAYVNVIFRKVGSTGWIIPAAKGRPFMQAAGEAILPGFRADIEERLAQLIEE